MIFALIAILLPCFAGTALLWYASTFFKHTQGLMFRLLAAGILVGFVLVTLLMRVYSLLGVSFSFWSLALPMILITACAGSLAFRRAVFACPIDALRSSSLPTRLLFGGLLIWIVIRFILLWIEVATQPLFPWEAILQSGAQAHVLFGQGKLVSFVDSSAWLNQSGGDLYFSMSPSLPQTLPLLQTWMCLAVGEWNDALMNLPWWMMLAALGFGAYGFIRQNSGVLISLAAAWFVTSLPLLNTHVALAGLPDLPFAAAYTLSALALAVYSQSKNGFDLAIFVILAFIAASFWQVSYVWLVTVLVALPFAFLPGWGRRGATITLTVAVLGILLLTQAGGALSPQLAALTFEFDTTQWQTMLIDGENWHVLWFAALVVSLFGARQTLKPPCGVLTIILIGAIAVCVAMICIPRLGALVIGAVHAGRIVLTVMPLLAVWCIAVWSATLIQANTKIPDRETADAKAEHLP
ncbi:MAG: hypothetical protein LBS40_06940 [Burkholderiales bacterium]|jgi:hypothetical protein|nr:hypothetical protein [Burkholderiales bacterium]